MAFPPHLTTRPPFSRTQSRLLHGPTPLCPGCGEEDVFLAPGTPVFLVHVSRGPPPFRAHLGHPAFHFSPSVSFPGSSPWVQDKAGEGREGLVPGEGPGRAGTPASTPGHPVPPAAPSLSAELCNANTAQVTKVTVKKTRCQRGRDSGRRNRPSGPLQRAVHVHH